MIPESELIINADGSIFHLHLLPEQLASRVILVGDPGRVPLVASHFERRECEVESREFHSVTGQYLGKRITVLSTGIGCDNIDIVMNELDALCNIDFKRREVRERPSSLTVVRVGTCGGLQADCPEGTFVASARSIGFDGLLNFYAGRSQVCDLEMEADFLRFMHWDSASRDGKGACAPPPCHPYVIEADGELLQRIAGNDMIRGITVACPGFFGPQGRVLRLPLADAETNAKLTAYGWQGLKVCNFEMESSAVAGLSRLMGHKALTVCMVIANRHSHHANTLYKNSIDGLIKTVLDRI